MKKIESDLGHSQKKKKQLQAGHRDRDLARQETSQFMERLENAEARIVTPIQTFQQELD